MGFILSDLRLLRGNNMRSTYKYPLSRTSSVCNYRLGQFQITLSLNSYFHILLFQLVVQLLETVEIDVSEKVCQKAVGVAEKPTNVQEIENSKRDSRTKVQTRQFILSLIPVNRYWWDFELIFNSSVGLEDALEKYFSKIRVAKKSKESRAAAGANRTETKEKLDNDSFFKS